MRSLLALAIIGAVMYVCGIDSNSRQTETPANLTQTRVDPKKDRETLMAELVTLAKEIAEASVNGDITLIARNTTDDFELTRIDGKVQNKNEALADVKQEKTIKSWSLDDPELVSFSEDAAVLRYTISLKLKNGASGRARVTDTFVKNGGQWLIKEQQQTLLREGLR